MFVSVGLKLFSKYELLDIFVQFYSSDQKQFSNNGQYHMHWQYSHE
jgi:hypothetical protein